MYICMNDIAFLKYRLFLHYIYNLILLTVFLSKSLSLRSWLIVITTTLCFQMYINHITCKEFKVLGIVLRAKEFKLSTSLKSLYCSLDRSTLEYGSVIWDPSTSTDSISLERVQCKFQR